MPNIGVAELVIVASILCLFVLLSAMVGGVGLKFLRQGKPTHTTTPLEIAQARYARGEITREQFEEIKSDLTR